MSGLDNEAERRKELDRKLSSLSVTVLVIIGLWLLLGPLWPETSGYAWMTDLLGGDAEAVPRFFLGFLFLYFAGFVREKNHLRETLHGMVEMIRRQLLDRGGSSVKEAVRILIQALSSEDAETRAKVAARLEKLTGRSYGEDKEAWERWYRTVPEAACSGLKEGTSPSGEG